MNADRRRLLAAMAVLACGCVGAHAQLPELVAKAKRSVVLVGSYGLLDSPRFGFRGTGFVVGDGLHVLTNAHVLPPEIPGRIDRSIAIQVWTPESQWVMRSARLVGTDVRHDLALLQIEAPAVPALRLAREEAREGTAIALIGFPLGGALGYSHVTHRGIVSARTAIAPPATGAPGLSERAVNQLRQGAFEVMQLDATAYPGNSGGPVLDVETGEVVGVVNMVLVKGTREAALSAPSGISYAIPVRNASNMLGSVGTR
ncbi:MAG: S1C family serine protease [Roseateles sp.]|uniref:S1C family serine protease n=1 Tax=Roseateles sp. TaxID=1971397 RepID=UPI00403621C3